MKKVSFSYCFTYPCLLYIDIHQYEKVTFFVFFSLFSRSGIRGIENRNGLLGKLNESLGGADPKKQFPADFPN